MAACWEAGVGRSNLVDDGQELLLEQRHVDAVPAREEDGVVRAVAVGITASAALADTVPVLARYTVDASNLVVRGRAALRLRMEGLQGEKEECPLVRLRVEHLSDFQSRVDGGAGGASGCDDGALPLLDLLCSLLDAGDGDGGQRGDGIDGEKPQSE